MIHNDVWTVVETSFLTALITGSISGFFGGGWLGPRVTHRLALKREQAARAAAKDADLNRRRRELLKFVLVWSSEIEHAQLTESVHVIGNIMRSKLPHFAALASDSEECFLDHKKQFDEYVKRIMAMDIASLIPQPDRGKGVVLANLKPIADMARGNPPQSNFATGDSGNVISK